MLIRAPVADSLCHCDGTPRQGMLDPASSLSTLVHVVKMHDFSVRELSVRLGGTRTGLLNASMVRLSFSLPLDI